MGKRIFYSNIPITNIQVMRGPGYCDTLSFVGHQLETDDPEVIKHLETIADRPGSGITTKSREDIDKEVNIATAEARAAAEEAHRKMLAAGLSTA